MKRSTILSLDAFAKTEEDVRIRTRSGGIITLCCVVMTLYLLLNEWRTSQLVVSRPQLVVDRDRNLKLELNIDVTFPSMPCDLLGLDIMDDSGKFELDVLGAGFRKTRLDSAGAELGTSEMALGAEGADSASLADLGSDYCGPCYGARDQGENEKKEKDQRVCCQTCEDVRQAYAQAGWAFFDGKNVEQCEREGYVNRINSRINEGCRVQGSAFIDRIQGNLHFAPGSPIQNSRGHFHDTSLYDRTSHISFDHIINHLSYGRPVESQLQSTDRPDATISTAPLDGRNINSQTQQRDTHALQYSYYTKIVPTRYEYLSGTIVETAQFSATFHSRPISGGKDADHPTTYHSRGGIPGLFIFFEMSPLKVINKEQRASTWSSFILNCITSIGGVLAVGTVADKVCYKAQRTIFGKKNV